MSLTFPTQKEEVLKENRFVKTWFMFLESVYKLCGEGRNVYLGGTLSVNTTDTSNTSGETDLISYTLEKNTVKYNKEFLEIKAFGTFAANGNSKTIKLYLGSTEIYTTTTTQNGGSFCINSTIIRTNSATQRIITEFAGTSSYTTATEDLTTNLTLKFTGNSATNGDITQNGMLIKLQLNN
jgi:hypothetical protein